MLDPRAFSSILREQAAASVRLEHFRTVGEYGGRNREEVFGAQTRQTREQRGLPVLGCEREMRPAGSLECFARPFHTMPAALRVHSCRRETPVVSCAFLLHIPPWNWRALQTSPQGFLTQSVLDQVRVSLQLSRCLKHAFSVFIIANSDRVTHSRQKDLAIPDFAGFRSF